MTQAQKAQRYDDLLRESDKYQRENSKLKSEFPVNVPKHIQDKIDSNNKHIARYVQELEKLMTAY